MVEGHTNWTTMFLQILFLICSVCNTHGVASTASPSCTSDEYRAGQLCCLACPGGYRVHRDCSATLITLCSKCPDGTFKEGLSGQKKCSNCTKCVTGQKVKKFCTPTSDAECEILDGFFCSESADKDTFSEATLSCQPHTICDSVGGVQIQPGTDSTDSTCFKYVAIAFIIIGCICFIISLVLGALFYRWLKMERDLTELEKQIDELETLEQKRECLVLWIRLQWKKKKTPKQKRKFNELTLRFNEKKESLELDWTLTELEKQIDEMETPDQVDACQALWERLDEKKKKTHKQQRKLAELIGRFHEEVVLEVDLKILEWCGKRRLEKTQKWNEKLKEWIDRLLKKEEKTNTDNNHELADQIRKMKMVKEEQDGEFHKLIHQLLVEIKEQERKITDGAAGEGTSGPSSTSHLSDSSSTSLLSTELPAGLETSIPPAPSSETQPAEETTPLLSSESLAPTGDQQEHTSRTSTPDVTMDGHDDDQSLDALAYRSGTGQLDIEMGPVRTLPKDRNRIL